jgi:hypothetical protein
MPEFAYAGVTPKTYPELRDANGQIVGTVEFGDVREFDREWDPPKPAAGEAPEEAPEFWPAPDRDWFPAEANLPDRGQAEDETKAPQTPTSGTATSVTVTDTPANSSSSSSPGTGAPPPGQPATTSTTTGAPAGTPAGTGQKAEG